MDLNAEEYFKHFAMKYKDITTKGRLTAKEHWKKSEMVTKIPVDTRRIWSNEIKHMKHSQYSENSPTALSTSTPMSHRTSKWQYR